MMPKRDKVQLAYLYFIPKPHKGGTPLRSIVSSMNMPTTGISKFLDKIIRSIFHKAARSITITDGVDLIQRLEAYTTNECLKSKTYLYTILAQEESLDILIEFLVQHGYQKIQNIPIDIIRKYVDDIFFMSNDSFESIDQMLDEANKFHPNIKLVRQIEAAEPYVAPFGSDHPGHVFRNTVDTAITRAVRYSATLSQFEEEIRQMNFIFLYNVYVDDIFFTSNDSLESIDQMLDEANNFHPNIKLVRQIGRSVPFLDVLIENRKGTLTISVYHKEAAEPYVVPFGSDHPGHVFRNTADTAITRAVRYSTTLSQFEEEIRQMNLIFLYNVYTSRHIDWRLSTLFSKYLLENFILPVLNTSDDFGYLHHQLLTTSTATAYNKVTRTSTANQTHDKNMRNQLLRPTDNNELTKGKSLIIHHRHEKRLRNTHRQILELWNSVFHGTEVINAALMLGTYLIQNLKQELCARMIKHIPSAGSNQEDKTQRQPDKQAANIQSNQTSQ
ncbi:unnamed protein product [Rotaria socialis]